MTPMLSVPLVARFEFYTWREALLQANEKANLLNIGGKPRVRWDADRWVLTYSYVPMVAA